MRYNVRSVRIKLAWSLAEPLLRDLAQPSKNDRMLKNVRNIRIKIPCSMYHPLPRDLAQPMSMQVSFSLLTFLHIISLIDSPYFINALIAADPVYIVLIVSAIATQLGSANEHASVILTSDILTHRTQFTLCSLSHALPRDLAQPMSMQVSLSLLTFLRILSLLN